ncbi:MAG: PEP-CTERM sorting domain-containing protein [Alphaproteobacteria bacterium]|nr:PEP-CTERM sorting domain-containing protein [Alphaproteobacteria bacterium]
MKRFARLSIAVAAAASMAAPASAVNFFRTYEAPGVRATTMQFDSVGVETFDTRPLGVSTFTSNFGGTGPTTGTFTNIKIINADQYGDVNGTGRYGVAFPGEMYELSLAAPVNYFGFWLSALNGGNTLSFYKGNTLLQTYNAATILDGITNFNAYLCNPAGVFYGHNCGEPYAFINFFSTGGDFDRVRFSQTSGGGFESDNYTIGMLKGTTKAVPEPGMLGLLGGGLGLLALARRRRKTA